MLVRAFSNSEWEDRGVVQGASFSRWRVREADWPAGPTLKTQGISPLVVDRQALSLLNFRMPEYKEAIWSLNRSQPAFTQALLSLRQALGRRPEKVKEENWRR